MAFKPWSWYLFPLFLCNFQRTFGVPHLEKQAHLEQEHDFRKLASAVYLQVSIISQALIFVTRSRSWSFMERPGLLLMVAFLVAQLVSELLISLSIRSLLFFFFFWRKFANLHASTSWIPNYLTWRKCLCGCTLCSNRLLHWLLFMQTGVLLLLRGLDGAGLGWFGSLTS